MGEFYAGFYTFSPFARVGETTGNVDISTMYKKCILITLSKSNEYYYSTVLRNNLVYIIYILGTTFRIFIHCVFSEKGVVSMELDRLTKQQHEAKYNARRYSYNKRKSMSFDRPMQDKLQSEKQELQTKTNEIKEKENEL